MRPTSLFVVALLAVAVGGCASLPASSGADTPSASAADLDSLAYERTLSPAVAPAQAQAQAQAPAQAQAQAQAPVTPAAAVAAELPYMLDTGDKLRVVVFGQDGLSNSYVVDASGAITMPLIKAVPARGLSTAMLARAVADRLRQGFVREPHVAIEVEAYRPFFILGEVTAPGQYAYVPQMTVEKAVAVAGGFTPRAYRWDIEIERPVAGGIVRQAVPPIARVRPGDTIVVRERWF
jgi:polysaccharide export outer membrane protein